MIHIFPTSFVSNRCYQFDKNKKVEPVNKVNKDCDKKKGSYQQSNSDSSTFQKVLEERREKHKKKR